MTRAITTIYGPDDPRLPDRYHPNEQRAEAMPEEQADEIARAALDEADRPIDLPLDVLGGKRPVDPNF